MKDPTLTAALRFIGKRPAWTPGRNYEGDRPNLNWPAFLQRLAPHLDFPRLRSRRFADRWTERVKLIR